MKFRYATLLAETTLGETGTEIIPIRTKDVISSITLRLYATAASTTISEHPATNIDKIEIVDGSKVLWSLTGQCGEAMDFFGLPRPRVNRIYYRNSQPWVSVIALHFGRFPFDPIYAFDPSKYENPQLKITWNIDLANTSASAGSLFVKAMIFEDPQPNPIGFLSCKEIKTYTPAANTWEYTDLPTDQILRSLAVQSRKTGTRYGATIADLILSEDNDKVVIFDDKASILAQIYNSVWGNYQEFILAYVGTALTAVYTTPGLDVAIAGSSLGNQYIIQCEIVTGCKVNVSRQTAAGYASLNVNGMLPHHVLCLPFGARDNPDQWYDPINVGNLRLAIKGGSSLGSSDTFRIITEQLTRY